MNHPTLKTAIAFVISTVLFITGTPHNTSELSSARTPSSEVEGGITLSPSLRPPDPLWILPIVPTPQIHRPFLAPSTPYSAGHRGVDFVVADRQPLRAPADGVIHFQGTVVDRPVVSIRHTDGYISSFEPAESSLNQGDHVAAGQQFGEIRHDLSKNAHCASGNDADSVSFPGQQAIAPCLHVGARLNGEYINPMILFGLVSRPILLPLGAE